MSTKIIPPPERFTVHRTGEPDRLAPAIAVPAPPDTERVADPAPAPAVPESQPVPAGAIRRRDTPHAP
jgi:hypothetical protein